MSDSRGRVVVLISGRGSNMRALAADALIEPSPYRIVGVISDQMTAGGLATARELGLPTRVVPVAGHADRAAYDSALAEAVDAYAPGLIVLAGFMRILSVGFVSRYAGRVLNIHPSLLPRYPGLHTHRRVLEAGDAHHGATVHFVTEALDGGPPIIQACIDVLPGDDEAHLAARVQRAEHVIYPRAVRWFCEGRLQWVRGQAHLDGQTLTTPVEYLASA